MVCVFNFPRLSLIRDNVYKPYSHVYIYNIVNKYIYINTIFLTIEVPQEIYSPTSVATMKWSLTFKYYPCFMWR